MGRKSQYDYRKWIVTRCIDELAASISKNPTIREVSERSGIPASSLHAYVKKLRMEGLVEWSERTHRGLALTSDGVRLSRLHNSAQGSVPF